MDMIKGETVVPIATAADIVTARKLGRALGASLGFSGTDLTVIATAISELARNILLYAARGEIQLSIVESATQVGIGVIARDAGPGIANLLEVLRDGYSTSGRLGLGLPGVRRLADRFDVRTSSERGTVVEATMWRP